METKQQPNNNTIANEGFSIAIIIAAFYYKYRAQIEEKLHDPFFMVFLLSGIILFGLVFYAIAHKVEKFFNEINMRRLGIAPDDKEKNFQLPPQSFDLQGQLNEFYENSNNRDDTFLGLGSQVKNKQSIVSIPDIQRSQHTQVLGMTGTGKTSGIFLPLIYQDALKKRPVIILDAKGELSSINQLNALLKSIGRSEDLLLFSLVHKKQSCTYNPLYVGECDPQIVIDAFFSNFKDENSFYRETAKTIFTNAFYVLHSLGKPFTDMDVYTYLTNDSCREAIDDLVGKSGKGELYLKLLNTMITSLNQQYKGWQHVITGFNNYLLSHKEGILNDPDSDIVLTDVIRQRKIVYFQLPTNAYPIQAVSIARMVQANLRYISSLIQIGQLPKDILVSVIIDEYASFAEESFIEVLNKARSSGMMVTIAHQSLSDLRAISEPFMKRIDENTLNKIYLKQTDPELCELIAKSMGTYIKEEKTYRMTGGRFGNQIYTGETSNRIVNEFYFPPDRIKNLHKRGQGYFIYRGTNSQQCVNLGYFPDLVEVPYERKIKRDKKQGLELFDKYYVQTVEKPSTKDIPLTKNLEETVE